jgi:hypothetical protein
MNRKLLNRGGMKGEIIEIGLTYLIVSIMVILSFPIYSLMA